MTDLQINADGMTVKPFQIKEFRDFPMIYLESEGISTIQYHRSVDGVTFTALEGTVVFDKYLHDPLYGVKVGEFIKITSDGKLLNAKILW